MQRLQRQMSFWSPASRATGPRRGLRYGLGARKLPTLRGCMSNTTRPAAGQHGESEAATAGLLGGGAEVQRLAEWEAWAARPAAERLDAVLQRLRERYCYCLYCGCRYDGTADMQQHCPGPSEADHE